jgi:quinol monooxygenase YgiN
MKYVMIGLIGMAASLSPVTVSQVHASVNDPVSVNAPVTADFVLFSSVKVKQESIVDFKNTVLPYAAQTRLEEGCIEYHVHQSPDDPTQFETYEHWKSDGDRQAHLAADYTVQFFKTTGLYFEPGYPARQKFIELR